MIHIRNPAPFISRLNELPDPHLRSLLQQRFDAFLTDTYDLRSSTEYLIVDAGTDTEADIIDAVGFSPLVEPIEHVRFGTSGFYPWWDWLADHGGWFELIVTVGNAGFAYILFVRNHESILPDLVALCRRYVAEPRS